MSHGRARLIALLAIVRNFKGSWWDWDGGCNMALESSEILSFSWCRSRVRELFVCLVGSLLCFPACMRMKLDLKGKAAIWISPLTIDSLVLLSIPSGPSDDQIESMFFKIGFGSIDTLGITIIVVFECVSDSIMNPGH